MAWPTRDIRASAHHSVPPSTRPKIGKGSCNYLVLKSDDAPKMRAAPETVLKEPRATTRVPLNANVSAGPAGSGLPCGTIPNR